LIILVLDARGEDQGSWEIKSEGGTDIEQVALGATCSRIEGMITSANVVFPLVHVEIKGASIRIVPKTEEPVGEAEEPMFRQRLLALVRDFVDNNLNLSDL